MTTLSLERAAASAGLMALVLVASVSSQAADATRGQQLAQQWCASCHIVTHDQARGADNVPAFAAIARRPGFDAEKLARFLMDPHPKMPDIQLDRREAGDLAAYIESQAQ